MSDGQTSEPSLPPQVVVFADSRSDRVAIAKSILMSAETPFWVRGEGVQDLFGWGRFPVGTNVFVGPTEILVCEDDAADAQAMLADLASCEPDPDAEAEPRGAGSDSLLWGGAKLTAKIVAVLILGYWLVAATLLALFALLGRM